MAAFRYHRAGPPDYVLLNMSALAAEVGEYLTAGRLGEFLDLMCTETARGLRCVASCARF